MQSGVSMAAVAMANGVNANLLRRWVREAELGRGAARPDALVASGSPSSAVTPSFGPVFAERAVTMGRGRFNAGFSYQHTTYRSFEGQDIGDGVQGLGRVDDAAAGYQKRIHAA